MVLVHAEVLMPKDDDSIIQRLLNHADIILELGSDTRTALGGVTESLTLMKNQCIQCQIKCSQDKNVWKIVKWLVIANLALTGVKVVEILGLFK